MNVEVFLVSVYLFIFAFTAHVLLTAAQVSVFWKCFRDVLLSNKSVDKTSVLHRNLHIS